MSKTSQSWLRDNAMNIIIAILLSMIGWGGNEAFQFFKDKIVQFETRQIQDIIDDAEMEKRVTKLESYHLNSTDGHSD